MQKLYTLENVVLIAAVFWLLFSLRTGVGRPIYRSS